MIPGKRGDFGFPENQRFHRNRGLFKAKVSEKGGIFLTWRALMGLTDSLRVGVPRLKPTELCDGNYHRNKTIIFW